MYFRPTSSEGSHINKGKINLDKQENPTCRLIPHGLIDKYFVLSHPSYNLKKVLIVTAFC